MLSVCVMPAHGGASGVGAIVAKCNHHAAICDDVKLSPGFSRLWMMDCELEMK